MTMVAEKKAPKKAPAKKKPTPAQAKASALAKAAQEIARAAGLKSAYLPSDANAFMAEFTVARSGPTVTLTRKGQEPVALKYAALKTFVAKEEAEVAKVMRGLCSGTRVYGRKAACLALATLAQEEARDA
jgi:hypothetical protein